MSRKHRKGYYVDGEFVAADAAEDPGPPSRTARKKAVEELQEVGAELIELPADVLAVMPLGAELRDAVLDAKRFASHGARRRQEQFIGKLMRQLDPDTADAVRAALRAWQKAHGK